MDQIFQGVDVAAVKLMTAGSFVLFTWFAVFAALVIRRGRAEAYESAHKDVPFRRTPAGEIVGPVEEEEMERGRR